MSTTDNLGLTADFLGLGVHATSLKENFEVIDAAVGKVLSASKTHDFASIADGARATTAVTVEGAELGDFVGVSLSVDLEGLDLGGYVSEADTVVVVARNDTGGAVDLASATLRVLVRKA